MPVPMQDNLHFYLESNPLFSRVREFHHITSAAEDAGDSFQVDGETYHLHRCHTQNTQIRNGGGTSIFMDEVYENVSRNKGQFDLVLWMNASNALAPESMPEPDIDISQFEQLARVRSFAPRPSVGQCLDWWEEWKLPENVQRHVTEVASAAYKLAVWMRQAGINVDPILTHRAGLVHDLDKIDTLHQAGAHGHVSAAFLADQGYSELAEIVRNHLLSMFLAKDLSAFSWEMKLVNFCDKLVEGDQIVPIPVRFSALKQRYPHSHGLLDATEPYLWQLNDEICSILSLDGHEALIAELNA